MAPDTIFAQGEVRDNPEGVNMANTGQSLMWVAVRGGIYDWAIYIDNPYIPLGSYSGVRSNGDKVTNEENIKKLVPCDDDAFAMYRY